MSSITGESTNLNFSRQGRYNAILLDEFAAVDRAETIWGGCHDSSPCKLVVSTHKGPFTAFNRLKNSGKIKVMSLSWKLHPEKDDAWYKAEEAKRTPQAMASEIDMNPFASAGQPYYGGFKAPLHVQRLSVNTHKELVLGWEYGWHHPYCVISQMDVKGRLVIHDVLLGENELIQTFATSVRAYLNSHYLDFPVINYDDPAGLQKSDKSKLSSHEHLAKAGFPATARPSNINEANYDARKTIIEEKLRVLIDGIPSLVINNRTTTQVIIEGFQGGYHYPDPNKHGFVKDRPVKDGYYEHVMNALEYIVVNLFSPIPSARKKYTPPKNRTMTSTPRREL